MKRIWFWGGVVAMAGSLFLGLGLVWVNIELVDLSYEIKELQQDLTARKKLQAKLEVERNSLVAPRRLRQLAREYGLEPAEPHQVRTIVR